MSKVALQFLIQKAPLSIKPFFEVFFSCANKDLQILQKIIERMSQSLQTFQILLCLLKKVFSQIWQIKI
jgi:hypothetical protein